MTQESPELQLDQDVREDQGDPFEDVVTDNFNLEYEDEVPSFSITPPSELNEDDPDPFVVEHHTD